MLRGYPDKQFLEFVMFEVGILQPLPPASTSLNELRRQYHNSAPSKTSLREFSRPEVSYFALSTEIR